MQFNFFIPTKIFFGVDCVAQHMDEFGCWGKKALVVTGRYSAKASGALTDVVEVLKKQGVEWEIFDQIEENPTFSVVEAGAEVARCFKPDMVIAIGGGSPLDASKAISVLAVNNITAQELFNANFAVQPLPILAIPLTAGTGSEVTQYSILTDNDLQTKRSFSHPSIFPKVAFLDARYTQTQSQELTINTAVDALSHAIEGYVSKRSTIISDCLAIEAISYFGATINSLVSGNLNLSDREALLYSSLLGGIVISQTGTTAVHSLGYSLTYFRNIPHGRANGFLLGEYLLYIASVLPEKVNNILKALNFKNLHDFKEFLNKLLPSDEVFSEEEIEKFSSIAIKAQNIVNTPRQPSIDDLQQLLRASLV